MHSKGKGLVRSRCRRIQGSRASMQHGATFERGLELARGQAAMNNTDPHAMEAQLKARK